jgi:hypothetical protein
VVLTNIPIRVVSTVTLFFPPKACFFKLTLRFLLCW